MIRKRCRSSEGSDYFCCRAQSFGRSDAAFERGVVSEDQHHRREEREERNGQQAGVEPPVASFKYPMA